MRKPTRAARSWSSSAPPARRKWLWGLPAQRTREIVRELTKLTIGYLCERESLELNDAINANWEASQALFANWDVSRALAALCEPAPALPAGFDFPPGWRLPRRPRLPRKRGRPPQRRERDLQIAGAIAVLVEHAGLDPARSHCGRRHQNHSACSIVTAALEQLGEHLSERRVEGIWDQYRQSPLIIHHRATDYFRHWYHQSDVLKNRPKSPSSF